jgi:lipopolysaccharide export system protein LptA
MLRSNRYRWLKNLLLLAGGAVAIVVGVAWLRVLADIDPFAYRKKILTNPIGERVAMRFDDVIMRQWEGKKLTAKAKVDRIDIMDNRQELHFFGVKNGQYFSKKGSFKFSAEKADWNAVNQLVHFAGQTRVANKDLDLYAANFSYNQRNEILDIPGDVKGRFFDGTVKSVGLIYDLKAEAFKAGPTEWEGKLKNPFQEPGGQTTKTNWKVNFKGLSSVVNGKQSGTGLYATDGQIKIYADKGERDMKTDVITGTGNIRYYSAKSNLTADKVVIDRVAKKAVLTDDVVMLIKPEDKQVLDEIEIPPFRPMVPEQVAKTRPPAPVSADDQEVSSTKTIRKYPISVRADKVEYWYGKNNEHAIITGRPQAQQELPGGRWRMVWAFKATYDGEKEELLLSNSGPGKREPQMKNSRGEDLTAEWFKISTKEDVEEWSAMALQGDVLTDDDEDTTANLNRLRGKKNPPPPKGGGNLKGPIGRGNKLR